MPHDRLSDRDRALLDFERAWQVHRGGKEQAIRERFGFSGSRYYALLAVLVDAPAALAHDPLLVRRLRRRRDDLRRRQAARALGFRREG